MVGLLVSIQINHKKVSLLTLVMGLGLAPSISPVFNVYLGCGMFCAFYDATEVAMSGYEF